MSNKIIIDEPGQLCNRFWSYVETISWAIYNYKRVYILFWDKSIQYFDKLRNNRFVRFPLYSKLGIRIFGYTSWDKYVHRLFPNNRLCAKIVYGKDKSERYVEGWPQRGDHKYLDLIDRSQLVSLFRPNNEIASSIETMMNKYHNEGYFIIGMHIRRGDYKEFFNGKYLYEHIVFADFMAQARDLYADKKVIFYIATNESYPKELFSAFEICKSPGNTSAHDLYALQLCDRIIGPPSSFSRWASFLGKTPLYFIFDKDEKLTDEKQFSYIVDHYHFADGRELPF